MASFQQFIYTENLPESSQDNLPACFIVSNATRQYEILLLRLLSGTLTFTNTISNVEINQRNNFSEIDFIVNNNISDTTIKNIFHNKISDFSKAQHYYENCHTYGNTELFKNLLAELTNFFYQQEKNSHTLAFLHLYRSVELVSYCFPLFYTSKSKNYEKTYIKLKDFFTKPKGELEFFKEFINNHLFKDELILDIYLTIEINAPNNNAHLKKMYYDAIIKLCDNNRSIPVLSTSPNESININRKGLTSLIYDLRNRYFHFLTGSYNDNFSSIELPEVDSFYKNVNDLIVNWIAQIYFELLFKAIEPN